MIDGLKPYPAYKESGLPWLQNVPSHWKVRRAKGVFRCIDVRSSTGDEELLTVSAKHGVIPRRLATVTMFKAESYIGYKLCWPGDLVINSLWAWGRGLGVSQHHGIVSSAYGVYRLRPGLEDYSGFIHELVRSVPFNWELQVRSKGIWISRLQLTDEAFLEAPIPLPPTDEQALIVRFLRHADRRIGRYIRAKKRLIALLNEQKQAIIHNALTRGLDPTVRLKASGVEWLGDVPENWSLKRFKFLVRVTSGQVDPRSPAHKSKILIAPNHIESGAGRITLQETAEEQGADSGKYEVRRGQVVYSKIRPNLRKAAIAPSDGLCSADMYPLTVRESELRPEFLLLLLLSVPFTKFVVDCSLRVAMPKVNREALSEGWLWYPDLKSQDAIVRWTSDSTAHLDVALGRAERSVSLLRDYRARLIAHVITGKIDVREAAARLPDDVEEPEPLDQADTVTDDDENDVDAVLEEAEA